MFGISYHVIQYQLHCLHQPLNTNLFSWRWLWRLTPYSLVNSNQFSCLLIYLVRRGIWGGENILGGWEMPFFGFLYPEDGGSRFLRNVCHYPTTWKYNKYPCNASKPVWTQRSYLFCLIFFIIPIKCRENSKVVPVHAMKTYRRIRGTAPLILNLGIRRWGANFTNRPLCPP